MPRARQGAVFSPESGFKFDCQFCESPVVQVPPPLLRFYLEKDGKATLSAALQCCVECAKEIDESNDKFQKKHKPPLRQVVPLRPDSELPPDVKLAKDEATKAAQNDAKLDKLVDAVGGLTTMMAQFMEIQLKGMVAQNAPSAPAQSEDKAEHANAKQKPSGARTTKPRSKRSR